MNKDLLEKLNVVRMWCRKKFATGDSIPQICSDSALSELARTAPRTLDEMVCVKGIGKVFVEKYGEYFLAVLTKWHAEKAPTKVLSKNVRMTLKNLSDRLVNINRRNRLLYLGKLYTRNALDMVGTAGQNIDLERLLLRQTELKITCNGQKTPENKRFFDMVSLLREADKDYRETGRNELYIGYPFIEGRMLGGDDFDIKAPLVLFPIRAERDASHITLRIDKTKDILYNTNLVLSHHKLAGTGGEIPDGVFESKDTRNFLEDVLRYYKEQGIVPTTATGRFEPYKAYTEKDFPKYKNGEYRVIGNAILGRFPIFSSALQYDFKKIADSGQVNLTVNELLSNLEDRDYLADDEPEPTAAVAPALRSDSQIYYINELNASQEDAMVRIQGAHSMVIQGPPGTGKSQTITSVIADFAARGKRVLMVSQKKAALDVIYSRLGELSRYALLVHDTKDKESFYRQVEGLLSVGEQAFDASRIRQTSAAIDSQVEKLDAIAEALYHNRDFGIPMVTLYQENLDNMYLKLPPADQNALERNMSPLLKKIWYPELKRLRDFCKDEGLLADGVRYYELKDHFPWLAGLKRNLAKTEIRAMHEAADQFYSEQQAFLKKSAIARAFSGGSRRRALKEMCKRYFVKKRMPKAWRKWILKNPVELVRGFAGAEEFVRLGILSQNRSKEQSEYLATVYRVSKELGWALADIVRAVFDCNVWHMIDAFETMHQTLIADVGRFGYTVAKINEMLRAKKALSREYLHSVLSASVTQSILSAEKLRVAEMRRKVESKRRWSVSKFIEKFSFELFGGVRIWLMTPEVVSEVLPLEAGLFDLLVFDEASQIYIEKGIPSLARASKVVIVGDHKQLRPSSLGFGRMETEESDEDMGAALEEESLLDLARFRYPEVMLNYHYRSRYEELIAFSNFAFYKGRLCISPNATPPGKPPIEVIKVEGGRWQGRSNRAEAERVVLLVKEFLATRRNRQTLGVITFNSNQRDLIMDLLDEACAGDGEFASLYVAECSRSDNGEDVGFFVKNIENVQGDERDCIVFSFAYARGDSGRVVRNFGWLNQSGGENRLNVAISRAKEKIFIVTSITPDELAVEDLANAGPKLLKQYLRYAYAVSDGQPEVAHQVLLSLGGAHAKAVTENPEAKNFCAAVHKMLTEAGFEVEADVGIGGYKIDLAIKDESGKYLLGIECDSGLYAKNVSSRERDIYRQRYLESRGWRIFRIWSSEFWRNPRMELRRIHDAVFAPVLKQ